MSADIIDALVQFLSIANDDDDLGCIVLTRNSDAFSSGGNIKEMRDGSHPMYVGSPLEMQQGYRDKIQQLPRLFDRREFPSYRATYSDQREAVSALIEKRPPQFRGA